MKINRMASEMSAPEWAFSSNDEAQRDFIDNVYIDKKDIERVANCDFDEDRIVAERTALLPAIPG